MLNTLIYIAKILIIFSYLIVGLYIIDIIETRFIYMNFIDYIMCSIGTIFIFVSMFTLYIFTNIKN